MASTEQKKKLALVVGNLPTVEEIDQLALVKEHFDITVISSESICGYLTQTTQFQDLRCLVCKDNDENVTFLPGLERALEGQDIVVVKERLGMYAFQAVKAKWRSRFRLICWVDNLATLPGDDVTSLRIIRSEITAAADAFIVQSKAARETLILEGVEEARIFKFKPHIESRVSRDKSVRAKAAARLNLADTDVIISHFGQIEFEESLLDLAHAFKLVAATDKSLGNRLKVVFCGIGSFSTELRNRLVKLGLDRHAVYVAPSRDAFATVIAASDALFFSPIIARDRIEGDPYRLMSAMAHGIPVIASRTPIVEEYVGKHRLDYCIGSPSSLAVSLKKLAGAKALSNNIVQKNLAMVEAQYGRESVAADMVEIFRRVANLSPTVDVSAIDHQVREIESLVSTKQYLTAIDSIESVFKNRDLPVHHQANLYRLIGDSFVKLGDAEAAKNAYLQSIELDQYSSKSFIGLGTICLTKGNNDVAVVHFQKAISLSPDDEMANLGLGLAFQGLTEYQEASRWVTKSLKHNPENTVALFALVQIAHARGVFKDAEACLNRYLEIHPNDHNMIYTLAGVYFKVENYEEALAWIEKVTTVDPMDERAATLRKQIQSLLTREGSVGSSNA